MGAGIRVSSDGPAAVAPCPLCGSRQVMTCEDHNNPIKSFARCRACGCQAPLRAWNNANYRASTDAA